MEHYKGKVWIKKGYGMAGNVYIVISAGKMYFVCYLPVINEENIRKQLQADGFNPDKYL